jgi:hypothetical protein
MAHQRSGGRRPIIGRWSYNVGYLLAHKVADGGGVWVACGPCNTWEPVNLARIILAKGPLYSLWNRRTPCPTCKTPMTFHAHHAPGSPVIPLTTDDPRYTDDLHRAAERERRRMIGMPDN